MERKLLVCALFVVATMMPEVASAALIYQVTVNPAAAGTAPGVPVGSEVSIDVAIAGSDVSEGLWGAAVKLDFGPGLILTGITPAAGWGSAVDIPDASWEGVAFPDAILPTDGQIALATFTFTATATSAYTVVDPFAGQGGGVFTAPLFTQMTVPEAAGLINVVVPEPGTMVGLGLMLIAMTELGWTRCRRHRV